MAVNPWDVVGEEPIKPAASSNNSDPWAVVGETGASELAPVASATQSAPSWYGGIRDMVPQSGIAGAILSLADQDSTVGNIARGASERVATLAGNVAGFASTTGKNLDESGYGMGGFVWSDGSPIPEYKSTEEYSRWRTENKDKQILRAAQKAATGADLGYTPGTTWEDVKGADGVLDTASKLAQFGIETGLVSAPDMAFSVINAPVYFTSRTEEIAQARAENDGRDAPDADDVAIGATTAAIVTALEKFGAERVFSAFIKGGSAPSKILRAATGESGSEFVQEQIEYAGESAGTKAGWDAGQSFERGLQGAVGGVTAGSGIAAVGAVVSREERPTDAPAASSPVIEDPDPITNAINAANNTVDGLPDIDSGTAPNSDPIGDAIKATDQEIGQTDPFAEQIAEQNAIRQAAIDAAMPESTKPKFAVSPEMSQQTPQLMADTATAPDLGVTIDPYNVREANRDLAISANERALGNVIRPEGLTDPRIARLEHRQKLEALASQALPQTSSTSINPQTDELLDVIAKAGGLNIEEAKAQGIDPDHFKDRPGYRNAFRHDGKSFDAMAETLSQYGYFGNEAYTVNGLLDKVNNSLSGNPVYSVNVNPAHLEAMSSLRLVPDMTPQQTQVAIRRALRGERIGVRQARAVQAALDVVTDERLGNVDIAKQQLEIARADRKAVRQGFAPLSVYEADDAIAGEIYEESAYDAEWDAQARTHEEWRIEALQVDPYETEKVVEDWANNKITEKEMVTRLLGIIAGVEREQEHTGAVSQGQRDAGTDAAQHQNRHPAQAQGRDTGAAPAAGGEVPGQAGVEVAPGKANNQSREQSLADENERLKAEIARLRSQNEQAKSGSSVEAGATDSAGQGKRDLQGDGTARSAGGGMGAEGIAAHLREGSQQTAVAGSQGRVEQREGSRKPPTNASEVWREALARRIERQMTKSPTYQKLPVTKRRDIAHESLSAALEEQPLPIDPTSGLINGKELTDPVRFKKSRIDGTMLEGIINAAIQHVRNGGAATFGIVDLGNLGGINHWAGQDGGDKAIADIASILSAHAGETIDLARQGGDEFMGTQRDGNFADTMHKADSELQEYMRTTTPRMLNPSLSDTVKHDKELSEQAKADVLRFLDTPLAELSGKPKYDNGQASYPHGGTRMHIGAAVTITAESSAQEAYQQALATLTATKNRNKNAGGANAQSIEAATVRDVRGRQDADGKQLETPDNAQPEDADAVPQPKAADAAAAPAAEGKAPGVDETQALTILDAAGIIGKERLDALKNFRDGTYSLTDLEGAYPAKQKGGDLFGAAPEKIDPRTDPVGYIKANKQAILSDLVGEMRREIAAKKSRANVVKVRERVAKKHGLDATGWDTADIVLGKALMPVLSSRLSSAMGGEKNANALNEIADALDAAIADEESNTNQETKPSQNAASSEVAEETAGENQETGKQSGPINTEDSGAELTYNKRNRLARGLTWDDVADKNDALRVKEVVKAKVYPKPDYEAMVADGMQPVIAHIVKQAYDSLAAKPATGGHTPSDTHLKTYIAGINRVMDGVLAWAKDADATSTWVASIAKRAGVYSGAARGIVTSITSLAEKAPQSLLERIYPDGWRNHKEEIRLIGGNRAMGGLQPHMDEAIKAMQDIDKGWPGKLENWQRLGYKVAETAKTVEVKASGVDDKYYTQANRRYIESYNSKAEAEAAVAKMKPWLLLDKRAKVLGQYDTQEAATEAARERAKPEKKDGGIDERGWAVEQAEREGPAHRMEGENISSDQLREALGFKGVNFGNWLKGESPAKVKERQLHLNHAYDSFMDLAAILDVPPKALSLNGMLGLAIGAQGSGKALAHFVPGVNEINLTRTAGAGALAHEWAHALDHYFATLGGLARETHPYLTDHAHQDPVKFRYENIGGKTQRTESPRFDPELRKEIIKRFDTIVKTMQKRPRTQEETKLAIESAHKTAQKRVNGWLDSIKRDYFGGHEAAFDKLADAVRNQGKVDSDGMIAINKTTYLSPSVAAIRDAYKENTGRVLPIDVVKGLQGNVDFMVFNTERMKNTEEHQPQMIKTVYMTESEAADGKKAKAYWSSPWEMFARAFDAFVSDTLAEKASKNTYLSGIEAVPPIGEERKKINAAFKALIDEFQTKETDTGVALFSRQPRFYSQLQRAIESAPDKVFGKAAQAKLWLQANAAKLGIKQDELQWSGILDYLDMRKGEKVSKEEAAAFLADNGVRVQDTVNDNADKATAEDLFDADWPEKFVDWLYEGNKIQIDNAWNDPSHEIWKWLDKSKDQYIAENTDEDGDVDIDEARSAYEEDAEELDNSDYYSGEEWEEARDEAFKAFEDEYDEAAKRENDDRRNLYDEPLTRYEKYAPPGGIEGTYREILVTLPTSERNTFEMWAQRERGLPQKDVMQQLAERGSVFEEWSQYVKSRAAREGSKFKSSHWDEPNVLVHLRTDEVTGTDGKRYLRVIEVQSDWHQARTQGKEVPDAPFSDTKAWVSLGIKRAIMQAVNSGVDGVVFATGQQNADLYDLSKQVQSISYMKVGDKYRVTANQLDNGGAVDLGTSTDAELEDKVGKEVAKKIVNGEGVKSGDMTILRGLDLKVGGEGMRAFYDQIVPSVANEVLKKIGGGKVAGISISGPIEIKKRGNEYQAWADGKLVAHGTTEAEARSRAMESQPGFHITDTMRNKVQTEGLPLFKKSSGYGVSIPAESAQQWLDAITSKPPGSPKVNVIASMNDAPAEVRAEDQRQRSQGAVDADPEGFYYSRTGEVYIVLSGVVPRTGETARQAVFRVFAHEVMGHAGLRGLFGKQLEPLLREVALKRRKEVLAKAREYGLDIGNEEDRLIAAEEVLAEMAQTMPENSLVVRAIEAIRRALRDLFLKLPTNAREALGGKGFAQWVNAMTDAEIIERFIAPARRYIERGAMESGSEAMPVALFQRQAEKGGARFSRPLNHLRNTLQEAEMDAAVAQPAVTAASSGNNRFDLPAETDAQEFIRRWQDELKRWEVVQDEIKAQGGTVGAFEDVREAMRRYPGRVGERLAIFTRDTVEPLMQRMAESGIAMDDIGTYLYARHAKDRNAYIQSIRDDMPNNGSGMSNEEAAQVLAEYNRRGDFQALRELADEVQAVTKKKLDLLESSGVITHDERLAMDEAMGEHYVPLKGFEAIDEQGSRTGTSGAGKGYSTNKRLDKRAYGRVSRAGNIVENIVRDYERAIIAAEKANIGRYVHRLVAANPDPTLWTIDRAPKQPMLGKSGVKLMPKQFDAENEVQYIDQGKAVRIQLHDPLLARAYNSLGAEHLSDVLKASASLNAVLRQMWTQKNPAFFLINPIRDVQASIPMNTGEQGAVFATKVLAQLPGAFKAAYAWERNKHQGLEPGWKDVLDLYGQSGARTGAPMIDTVESKTVKLHSLINKHGGQKIMDEWQQYGAKSAAKMLVFKMLNNRVIDVIEHLNGGFENMTRLATFKQYLDEHGGATAVKALPAKERAEILLIASRMAKNVTVNFNDHGEMTRGANALYLFFNANVQGTSNIAKAALASKHKMQVRMMMGSLVMLGMMLSLMADDDEDELTDEHIKQRNLVFHVGDQRFQLPMPYGWSWFVDLGRYLGDVAMERKEPMKAAIYAVSSFFGNFSPLGDPIHGGEGTAADVVQMIAPTVFKPGVMIGQNRGPFGNELMPESQFDKYAPDRTKMWRGTRGSAYDHLANSSALAWADVSPESLKTIFQFITGGTGRFAADTYSAGSNLASGSQIDPEKLPIASKFYAVSDVEEYRGRFYEQLDEADRLLSQAKRLQKESPDEGRAFIEEHARAINLAKSKGDVFRSTMKKLRDQEDRAREDKDITLVEQYEQRQVELSKRLNDALRAQ